MSQILRLRSDEQRAIETASVWLLSLAVAASFVAGCAVSKKHAVPASEAPPPAKEASEADLVAAYNRLSGEVTSINASVQMTPTAGSAYTGVIEQYHQVNGFILAQKPASIRVIGQAPVISKDIFDMTSDGTTFRIYIPSKNQFITGPTNLERAAEKPIENLRPQHLVDALFWPEIAPATPVLFEEFDEPAARYYILTLLRNEGGKLRIDRKLWFDRADLSLARIVAYDAQGRVTSDTQLADWQPATTSAAAGNGGETLLYPRRIVLNRPRDNYQLEVRITKLTLNEPISPDRFQLAQPPGTKLVQLGDTGAGSQF